jgi:hypothetical protein
METEKNQTNPQDTVKKTLPYLTPAGRVEDFYDFSGPANSNDHSLPNTTSKKLTKLNTEKPKVKKVEKPTIKVVPVEPPKLELAETDSILEVPLEAEIKTYKFLTDTPKQNFDLTFLSKYYKEEDPEITVNSTKATIYYAPSVFAGHELKVQNLNPIPLPPRNDDGLAIAFVAILGIFSLVKVGYYKKAKQYVYSFFNLRINLQVLRTEKSVNEQLYAIMLLASVLITSSFLFQIINHYKLEIPVFENIISGFAFFKIFSVVILAIFIKFGIIRMLGYLFNYARQASDYIFNQILFFNILNLGLFPLCVGLQYSDLLSPQIVFVVGAALVAMVFAFMLQRLMVLGNSEAGTSTYYLFLYLCTLEILPVIILAKLMLNTIS